MYYIIILFQLRTLVNPFFFNHMHAVKYVIAIGSRVPSTSLTDQRWATSLRILYFRAQEDFTEQSSPNIVQLRVVYSAQKGVLQRFFLEFFAHWQMLSKSVLWVIMFVRTVVCLHSSGEWDWKVRIAVQDWHLQCLSDCHFLLFDLGLTFFFTVWKNGEDPVCWALDFALHLHAKVLQLHSFILWLKDTTGPKRFFHWNPHEEYNTMHVCVCNQIRVLAVRVTNCLPCNQPLFACCSHQNSLNVLLPWQLEKSAAEIFFFLFFTFMSAYLADKITFDQFKAQLVMCV